MDDIVIENNKKKTKAKKEDNADKEKKIYTRLLVTDRARRLLKQIAAAKDKTMLSTFDEIVDKEWEKVSK